VRVLIPFYSGLCALYGIVGVGANREVLIPFYSGLCALYPLGPTVLPLMS